VSGRGGSGSFVAAAAPLGMPSGRSDITLAGSRCRDPQRPCPRLGSKPVPAPRTRYEVRASLRRVLTAATATSTPFRAPVSVCGAGCARAVGVRESGVLNACWFNEREGKNIFFWDVGDNYKTTCLNAIAGAQIMPHGARYAVESAPKYVPISALSGEPQYGGLRLYIG